jgi:hypothetical protein
MTDLQADRLIRAVERIADALEGANKSDPMLVLQRAIEANDPSVNAAPTVDPNADMPPHIRRILEEQR